MLLPRIEVLRWIELRTYANFCDAHSRFGNIAILCAPPKSGQWTRVLFILMRSAALDGLRARVTVAFSTSQRYQA